MERRPGARGVSRDGHRVEQSRRVRGAWTRSATAYRIGQGDFARAHVGERARGPRGVAPRDGIPHGQGQKEILAAAEGAQALELAAGRGEVALAPEGRVALERPSIVRRERGAQVSGLLGADALERDLADVDEQGRLLERRLGSVVGGVGAVVEALLPAVGRVEGVEERQRGCRRLGAMIVEVTECLDARVALSTADAGEHGVGDDGLPRGRPRVEDPLVGRSGALASLHPRRGPARSRPRGRRGA